MIPRTITIHPIDPPGGPFTVALGDGPSVLTGGSGGWAEVDRPRRVALVEWRGTPPYRLSVPVLFDAPDHARDDVEAFVSAAEGLCRAPANAYQPPVFRIAGPLPHTERQWVMDGFEWTRWTRRPDDGLLVQVFGVFSLLEYVEVDLFVTGSPAEAAVARAAESVAASTASTPAGRTHTVTGGETLSAIAARLLGNANRWKEIATLNDIRDPRTVKIGQVLRLP